MTETMDRTRCFLDYVDALEEERRKIDVFRRELPLCLQLITQTIEKLRQQIESREVDAARPLVEEFLPLNPTMPEVATDKSPEEKSDWLQSAQLWVPESSPSETNDLIKPVLGNVVVFETDQCQPLLMSVECPAGGTDSFDSDENHVEKDEKGEGKKGRLLSRRKARRCWSFELHRRFENALEQLGGSKVATPKQIREVMKVEGLTNDEVKSHLQKYRLHNKRPNSAVHSSVKNNAAAPQFVVGIWIPPTDCNAVSGITAPRAAAPLSSVPRKDKHGENKKQESISGSPHKRKMCYLVANSYEDGNTNSCSPPVSASSLTTILSPRLSL